MATSSGLPWWKEPPDPREDSGIDESLRRAMDEDPRLSSGTGPASSDNVLDFIQMTGLTTGRLPEARSAVAAAPYTPADDPISFFEYGVRDVDGSGDPTEGGHAELDIDAFKPESPAIALEESRSLTELKQIIAELAEETDPSRATYARLTSLDAPTVMLPAALERKEPAMRSGKPDDDTIVSQRSADAPAALGGPSETSEPSPEPQLRTSAAGLAAARDLVRELSQANEEAAERQRAVKSLTLDLKHPVTAAREELPEPDNEKEDFSSHSHLGLPRRRHRSFVRRWLPMVPVVMVVALIGYGVFYVLKVGTRAPRAAFDSANALLEAGEHRAASDAFLSFTKRYEGHPRAADALFNAGYALQLEPATPTAKAKAAYTEAIGIFQKFTSQYPTHEKTPRAETLMGLLYYKTGQFLEAISLLGEPDRRLRDPGAYLMALRTLGRSYVEIGQMDNARSAFLRAAALESNMTPDQDYVELATIYQDLGARSGDPVLRRRYFAQAIEQWDFAMQVPGLLKTRKDDIKLLRDAAASRLDPGAAKPVVIEGTTVSRPGAAAVGSGNASVVAGETPPAKPTSGPAPK